MSALIGQIQPFQPETDDFEKWVRVFEQFLIANDIDKSGKADKCRAIFCATLGLSTYTLLEDLISPKRPEALSLDELTTKLQDHFKPAPKALSERFKFGKRTQQQGETVSQYLAELRKLASTCKFTCCLEERLRDQLIIGLNNAQSQKRLFTEDDDVKLAKVISIALAQESAVASTVVVRELSSEIPGTVHKVLGSGSERQQTGQTAKWAKSGPDRRSEDPDEDDRGRGSGIRRSCVNCGSYKHFQGKDCPAKDRECRECGKMGHFARCCRSNPESEDRNGRSTHNYVRSLVNRVATAGGTEECRPCEQGTLLYVGESFVIKNVAGVLSEREARIKEFLAWRDAREKVVSGQGPESGRREGEEKVRLPLPSPELSREGEEKVRPPVPANLKLEAEWSTEPETVRPVHVSDDEESVSSVVRRVHTETSRRVGPFSVTGKKKGKLRKKRTKFREFRVGSQVWVTVFEKKNIPRWYMGTVESHEGPFICVSVEGVSFRRLRSQLLKAGEALGAPVQHRGRDGELQRGRGVGKALPQQTGTRGPAAVSGVRREMNADDEPCQRERDDDSGVPDVGGTSQDESEEEDDSLGGCWLFGRDKEAEEIEDEEEFDEWKPNKY
jgi:hypothetical protein